ncbi:MAG: hypothetical protein NW226_02550 [Microscillaceae bacterium]|nr:hypothetical protein [Microscillaceae bacterium]
MKSIRLSKSMFLMIFLFFTLHIGLDTALAQDQATKYALKSDYEGSVFYSKFDYRGLRVNFPLNFKKSWLRASPIFDGVLFDSLILRGMLYLEIVSLSKP